MKFWNFPDLSKFPKILILFFFLVWAQRPPQRRKCRYLILKSFRNSWGYSCVPCLLLIITLFFHLWWKENFLKYQKVSKYFDRDFSIIFKCSVLVKIAQLCLKNCVYFLNTWILLLIKVYYFIHLRLLDDVYPNWLLPWQSRTSSSVAKLYIKWPWLFH